MRYFISFLLFFVALSSSAQQKKIFDTSFVNAVLKEPFTRINALTRINYSYNSSAAQSITVNDTGNKVATKPYVPTYYNLNFIGDRYLFEKRYGPLDLPFNEIRSVLNKKCGEPFYLHLTVFADSIHLQLESYCPAKNDDERIFTKVEVVGGYQYGMKKFEERIQAVLDQKYFPSTETLVDSIYLFNIVTARKDSCVMRTELLEGAPSFFTQVILNELKKVCSWLPPLAGGIPVNAYRKIYVRLNKDKKVTVAYPEN